MSSLMVNAQRRQRAIEFRLFGPELLIRDGEPVGLSENGQRELLALLLLTPSHRVYLSDVRRSITIRPSFQHLRVVAGGVSEALADSGTSIRIDSEPDSDHDAEVELVGALPEIDLDRCGPLVKEALGPDTDGQHALANLKIALKIMAGTPLAGVSGRYFDMERRRVELTRAEVAEFVVNLELAAAGGDRVVMMTNLAASLDTGLPYLQQAVERSIGKTPTVSEAKQEFLRSILSDRVAQRWSLARRATSRKQEILLSRARSVASQGYPSSWFEVSIYLGHGQRASDVEAALDQFLEEADLETFGQETPIVGSWYRRLWARTNRWTGHLDADQVAAELERKLRIEVFDKAQATIDNQQATGAAALIAALQGEERACIRVGSILVLKVDGHILVNNLTQYQLAWLERNQLLLRDPEGLLKGLGAIAAQGQPKAVDNPVSPASNQSQGR